MATLMDKYYNVRIKLRNDSWTNWESKQDLVPYDGEVIIYDIPTIEEKRKYRLDALNYQIIKIGDGVKTLKELPAINEMSSALNITMGSKNGTISVSGNDVYVKGLNNSTIMCFEPQSKYQTASNAIAIKNQISQEINEVASNLEALQISTTADIAALRSLINNSTGGGISKIEEIEAKIIAEENQRQIADEAILTEVRNNKDVLLASLQAISTDFGNSIDELNATIISETQAREEKDNSLQSLVNKLTSSVDSLEESFTQLGGAGIVSLREGEGSYELLQNDVVVGTIVLPQDTYLTEGRIVKINGETILELSIKGGDIVSISLDDLINNYDTQQFAEKVQLQINNDNIISASLVANSITSADIANGSILEDSLSSEVRLKLNSGGNGTGASQDQLDNLKNYIDTLVNLESGVQAGTYGINSKTLLKHGDNFVVPSFKVNDQGKITEASFADLYLPNLSYNTGTINGTVMIDGKNIEVKGLGSAAYTASDSYDTYGSANSALSAAKEYADGIKQAILGGAEPAYDTLMELKKYIDDNSSDSMLTALQTAIAGKSDKQHVHAVATSTTDGFMSAADKAKFDNFASSTITGVIAGSGLTGGASSGNATLAVNTSFITSGKNYAVIVDNSTGGLYVNVPWPDNNDNYTHPTGSAANKTLGLYKIATDGTSHIKQVIAVTKDDIVNLGIPSTDTIYEHPNSAGYKHIPSGGASGQILKWSSNGTAVWANENMGTNTTYTISTGDSNGQIKVAPSNGNSYNVSVKGLGSAAYTASTAYAPSEHTHNYAGSSSAGGSAISAEKLNTNNGSATQPVYFKNGIPVATTYSLNKSVPANAVFTDTTYELASSTTDGLMSAADKNKLNSLPNSFTVPVTSVNGKTGAVSLTYSDVGASELGHTHSYLSLNGGTLTGGVNMTDNLIVSKDSYPSVFLKNANGTTLGRMYIDTSDGAAGGFYLRATNSDGTHKYAYLNLSGEWHADTVWGAVYNDYAEFRSQNEDIEPGYITYCDDDGKLKKTTKFLQKYEGIVSDTFGFAIGKTDDCKTPLAVSGRALVYCDPKEHFHSGDCVCAGPDGLAYRMTREEIIEFPDRIVGVVSEIPTYKTWGTGNVAVNGRIWIKVR